MKTPIAFIHIGVATKQRRKGLYKKGLPTVVSSTLGQLKVQLRKATVESFDPRKLIEIDRSDKM